MKRRPSQVTPAGTAIRIRRGTGSSRSHDLLRDAAARAHRSARKRPPSRGSRRTPESVQLRRSSHGYPNLFTDGGFTYAVHLDGTDPAVLGPHTISQELALIATASSQHIDDEPDVVVTGCRDAEHFAGGRTHGVGQAEPTVGRHSKGDIEPERWVWMPALPPQRSGQ